MRPLHELLRLNKNIRVIGFDDAPFNVDNDTRVKIAGVICSNTRFEGMLWGDVSKDGTDATDYLIDLLINSKFYEQVNVILIDGIAVGGFNIIDLPKLSNTLNRPCIAVIRNKPDLESVDNALKNFSDYKERKQTMSNAGEIIHFHPFYFQVSGCSPETAFAALKRLTDCGHVPEALRLAHLIGSAIINGESGRRA